MIVLKTYAHWNVISFTEILNVISKMLTDYPSPTGMWLGPEFFVLLDHPIDIETVLTSPHCTDKAKVYHMVRQVLETDGLVSNEGNYDDTFTKGTYKPLDH